MKNSKILFLYTRRSGYLEACLQHLTKNHSCSVLLIYWSPSSEAPFKFDQKENSNIKTINKLSINKEKLFQTCQEYTPHLVFISGWLDKDYCALARIFKKQAIPVIMGMDNPWKNNLRQNLGVLFYKKTIFQLTDYVWVAGKEQKKFAKKLGFSDAKIFANLYSADVSKFAKITPKYSKKILFIGRLLKWKGILDLTKAFSLLDQNERNGWELIIVGQGKLMPDISKKQEGIQYLGFKQPDELIDIISHVGAFILPSHDEHWGVIVHEAAASGLPLLLSNKVRAREKFLIPNQNGFEFKAKDVANIQQTLKKLFLLSSQELKQMGTKSREMGLAYTPLQWSRTLLNIIKN